MMRFEWNWWDLRNELKCNWRLIPNDEWTNWFTEREDAAMDQWDRPPKCYWGGGILLVMVNGKGAVSAVPPFLGWIFPFFFVLKSFLFSCRPWKWRHHFSSADTCVTSRLFIHALVARTPMVNRFGRVSRHYRHLLSYFSFLSINLLHLWVVVSDFSRWMMEVTLIFSFVC